MYNIQAPASYGIRANALSSVDSVWVPWRVPSRAAHGFAARTQARTLQHAAVRGRWALRAKAGSALAGAGASDGAGYRGSQLRVELGCGASDEPIVRT